MKKILLLLVMAFVGAQVNAQITSVQANQQAVSVEMRAQIQEALRQQENPVPQAFNRTLTATYVGSFMPSDGPNWSTNPQVYSGVEAAALIFGGSPSDYAISTNSNTTDPSTITNTAWASAWGSECREVAENYSLDLGAPGYNDPAVENSAVSAYVEDWCFNGQSNYVWFVGGSSSDFITTWQTTASNETITIPTTGSGYNYSVDWGDGAVDTAITSDASHTYITPGVYTVKISGAFPRIFFNNSGDRLKIKSIEQWGTNSWSSMNRAFMGCENLVSNATDTPNLSTVTDMYAMFAFARKFNGDANMNNWNVSTVTNMNGMFAGASVFNRAIGNWNVSNVNDMENMFNGASKFNRNIGSWNVGNVVNMKNMFKTAILFNQSLDSWNVGNVTNMYAMFGYARKFNGAIGSWNVGNVTNMYGMFGGSSVFNKDISAWNVGNVTNMENMFHGATKFNQDIGSWDVTNVTNMINMLASALNFNQDLGSWNVSNVTKMTNMLKGVTLSTANYDSLLNGWNSRPLQSNVKFHGGNSTYCAGAAARDNMINTYGWTIFDGGQFCGPNTFFVTTWQTNASNQTITIPTSGSGYNYDVNWNYDENVAGTWESGFTGDATHNYASAGTYTVAIRGTFPRIFFANSGDRLKIKSIEQWGASIWSSMNSAFMGCENLISNATDMPDLSVVTDMYGMFAYARKFNGDAQIGNWNVSGVTNMIGMFAGASVFNQPIGNWNVSNVASMENMFNGASNFNQNLGNWNVSSVSTMKNMFRAALVFNQDIGNWNVSNVTSMNGMFAFANLFNQDLGNWNVSNVTDMALMFRNVTLSTANYDSLLNGWNSGSLNNNVKFHGGFSTYCAGETARDYMINTRGWIITDGGKDCTNPCGNTTVYSAGVWSNGAPTMSNKAVFASNYTTAVDGGSIDACGIVINAGVTVTVSAGTTIRAEYNMDINSAGKLVFESTATGDGELGVLGPDASISGNATVQRYMSANRSYRMLSPAVSTMTSINANWQEGVHNIGTAPVDNQNPSPGFGTHITGSQTGANGFDATLTGNASMFIADVATQQFMEISNTDVNNFTAGDSYLINVRGDRSIDLTDNDAFGETVLRATGQLAVGSQPQNYTSPSNGAFVMFGNPYQSAVDVSAVFGTSTNVNTNEYYVYDPTLGDHGAYVTVTLSDGTSVPASDANQYLQPGQAAQLATLGAGAVTVDFQEAYKTPGNFTATNATNPVFADAILTGKLYTQQNYNNGGPVHDSFMMRFAEENSNALNAKDAVKPMNFYENLGINQGGTYLSIERRSLPEGGESFSLYTNGYEHTEYVLEMELNGLDDVAIYLEDNFTGESTLLEQGVIAHSFTIENSKPESLATDRFIIRVGERLGVNDSELLSGITLYPNPMGSQLNLANPKNLKLDSVSIYDLTGRLIQTVDLNGATSEMSLDVSSLSNATYMVVIAGEAGQISKLMIKK